MWRLLLTVALFCSAAFGKAIDKRNAEINCPEKACRETPLELSFVVDASASIWPANFTQGLWFINRLLDTFDIAPDVVRVSVITYGDRVYTEDAINYGDFTTKQTLEAAIDSIPYPSGLSTQTGAGINYMLDSQLPSARAGVRKVIVVLTDGNSQEPDVTKAAADRALEAGLEVFAIGVGHQVSLDELRNIASDDTHVFTVDSYHLLDNIVDSLHLEACGKPLRPEPLCHQKESDIAFVIDSSQSIGQDNFTDGLEFIVNFLEPFDISPEVVRVAAVMFGYGVYGDSALGFEDSTNKKDLLEDIRGLEWMHGIRTDTGAGIDYMMGNFLPKMRKEAAHIGIVITDGKSQKHVYTEEEAKKARDAGIVMYAVGVGKVGPGGSLDERELNQIAGDPSRVITVEDYAKLDLIRTQLMDIACAGINQSLVANIDDGLVFV